MFGVGWLIAMRVFGGGAQAALTEPSLNLIRTALALFVLVLIGAEALLGGRLRAPRGVIFFPIVMLALGLGQSVMVAVDTVAWGFSISSVVEDLVLLLAVIHVATAAGGRERNALFALVLAAAICVFGVTLKEVYVDQPAAQAAYQADPSLVGVDGGMRADLESRLFAQQASGPFLLPNGLSAMFAMALALGASLLVFGGGKGARGVGAVVTVAGVAGLGFAAQKGGGVAGALGLLGALGYMRLRSGRGGGGLCVGGALLCAIALPAAIAITPAPVLEKLPGGLSLAVRHEYGVAAMRMVRESPFRGVGAGNFSVHYGRLKPDGAEETRYAHNDELELLAEGGPVAWLGGFALWVALLGLAILGALGWRRASREEPEPGAGGEAPKKAPVEPPAGVGVGSAGLMIGAVVGGASLLLFGMAYRQVATAATLGLGLGAIGFGLSRVLARRQLQLEAACAAGAFGAALAFVAQSGIDFVHREPGLLAVAWMVAVYAATAGPRGAASVLARPGKAGADPKAERRSHLLAGALVGVVALLLALPLAGWFIPWTLEADQSRLLAQESMRKAEAAPAGAERAVHMREAYRAFDQSNEALKQRGVMVTIGDLLAQSFHGTGDPAQRAAALIWYRAAVEDRPDLAFVKQRIAGLLETVPDPEALRWHEDANRARPGDPRLRLAWAEALGRAGDKQGAAREATRALALDPLQRQLRSRLAPEERQRAEKLANR
jgi:hypothetical protein